MRRTDTIPRRAISLVEAAATTVALAALIAMLVPALEQIRRDAKQRGCLSNFMRLGEATAAHASGDPKEWALPMHADAGQWGTGNLWEWGGKSGKGEPQGGSDYVTSLWGTKWNRGPATRGLNKIIYGDVFPDYREEGGPNNANWKSDSRLDLSVFRCPDDAGYSGFHRQAWANSILTSYDHFGNSYAANVLSIRVLGGPGEVMSNSPMFRPSSRVPNPGATILLMENCGLFAAFMNYVRSGCRGSLSLPSPEVYVLGWHGRRWIFTSAFVDGHAAVVYMNGHDQPQAHLPRFPSCQGSDSECYRRWRCGLIRGPGWQQDTLPSPPIPTGWTRSGFQPTIFLDAD